jgi:hypothetical protein
MTNDKNCPRRIEIAIQPILGLLHAIAKTVNENSGGANENSQRANENFGGANENSGGAKPKN